MMPNVIDEETRAWAQPWKEQTMFQAEKELTVANRTGRWHGLAEQIREGCKIAPKQAFDILFRQIDGSPDYDTSGKSGLVYEACVEGAIVLAGGQFSVGLGDRPTVGPFADCPHCVNNPILLVHLNNQHQMTREAIADGMDKGTIH
jgi:hypothetical protein